MIPRYSRSEMTTIWELENKFNIWLEIELLACEAQAKIGVIPSDVPEKIRHKATFNVPRIDEIEKEVRHDVIAFLTCVAESVGDESRYVHMGMTSSDVVDTGFAVQLTQAADIIIAGLDGLLAALKKLVVAHRDTLCIGRSHGVHAEPTTFGLKLAGHYAAFKRARYRMVQARDEVAVCKLSGAVGTYATIDPSVEKYVADKLNLKREDIATQIIPRDRHAMYFATLGVIASSIENLVTEIRHLQRSEVREVEEGFAKGQKGSSAMPHKKNPILSENLTGLARLIRATVIPALENVTLWHERDMSHSSVERINAPDATILLDFSLHRLTGIVEGLQVYPDRMRRNLESLNGLVFSQSILMALAKSGLSREEAYSIVQDCAMRVWNGDGSFQDLISADDKIKKSLLPEELSVIFDYKRFVARTGEAIDAVLVA